MKHSTKTTLCALCALALLGPLTGCVTEDASGCEATERPDGSVSIQCNGGDPVTLAAPAGEQGSAGDQGPAGEQGPAGADGQDAQDGASAAVRVEQATMEQCAFGGSEVFVGLDLDGSGALEAGEESQSFVVCQGAPGDGKTALVASSEADPADCPDGGRRVEVGLDDDQSGTLEPGEVLDAFDVCDGAVGPAGQDGSDGADGQDGRDGQDGSTSLLKVTREPPGPNCPDGGQRLEVGVDADADGTLDPSEVDPFQTAFVCDPTERPFQATQISAGFAHTCALTPTGGVRCWGSNFEGQLGDGGVNDSLRPVEVSGLTSGVSSISSGGFHTCAVMNTGGVKCWGRNSEGQLGDGTITRRLTPVDVSGLTSGVASVSVGDRHTCAVTSGGGAKCWGLNNHGQLGDGTLTPSNVPVDVVGLTSGVASVSVGDRHTCAVTSGGGAKCWGRNSDGRLGDGTTTERTTPMDVSGLTSGVASIAAGALHTCAVTTAGVAQCWGDNTNNQLGDGSTTRRLVPVSVSGLTSGVASISVGPSHACAVTTAGAHNAGATTTMDGLAMAPPPGEPRPCSCSARPPASLRSPQAADTRARSTPQAARSAGGTTATADSASDCPERPTAPPSTSPNSR